MKLYYDMLIPYMPDSVKTENGEFVQDAQRLAGREAMIKLAEFQQSGNITCLYHSVISACTYAGVDLVDTILGIPDDMTIEDGTTLNMILDDAAKNLFSSIKPGGNFNVDLFVCNLLNAAHAIISSQTVNAVEDVESQEQIPEGESPTE